MLIGPGKLTCIGNQWDQSRPICQRVPCQPITRDAGFTSVNGFCSEPRLGEVCVTSCPPFTRADGEPSFRCTETGWVTNFKECLPVRCQSLSPISNGVTVGACSNDIKPADNCSYSCSPGYALVGSSLLTCLTSGQWDYSPPECILIICPRLSVSSPLRINGNCLSNSGSEARPGTICNFSCEPCFNLIGSPVLACLQNGRWNGSIPACRPVTCPPISGIQNGIATGTCGETATCQSVCTIQCNPGFILGAVSSNLICQPDGRWNGPVPQCIPEPRCPSLTVPANAVSRGTCQAARRGETCEFTCQACFNPVGVTRVTCLQNGIWDNPFGSCSPILCPNPPLDSQLTGTGSCNNARCGDTCRFQCSPGYQIQGEYFSLQHRLIMKMASRCVNNRSICQSIAFEIYDLTLQTDRL